ncbi:MAG: histidine kinase N-terminal 7TM domain-containing protein [Candidatus Hodarchaeales archaeon]
MSTEETGSYFLNLWALPYFLGFFICFLLAWFIFYKKRDNTQVILFAGSLFWFGILCFGAAMATSSLTSELWFFWSLIMNLTAFFGMNFLYHFSEIYLNEYPIFEYHRFFLVHFSTLAFVFVFLFIPDTYYPSIELMENSSLGKFGSTADNIYWIVYYAYFALLNILASINFIKMYRQNDDIEKKRRAAYFIIGVIYFLIVITITVFINFILLIKIPLEISIVSIIGFAIIITFGILKDNLFDMDEVISTGVTYTITSVFLMWIFMISEETLNTIIHHTFFAEYQIAYVVSAIFVVILFIPFHELSEKLTEKLFPHAHTTAHTNSVPNDLTLYRKQLSIAWKDGTISDDEREMLKSLQNSLKISDEDHEKLIKELNKKE